MSTPVVTPAAPVAVEYPSSDGKPMAENDAQRLAMVYAMDVLATRFAEHEDVYVSGDLLIYYEEDNRRVSIAPDVFVVYGVAKRKRMTYLLWEEGKAPDFVLEVASPSTWREDEGAKRRVYERLGVTEYYQYDPTGEHLGTQLKGARLSGGRYEAQEAGRSASGGPTLSSEVLELELSIDGAGELRFRDPETGQVLLSHREEHVRGNQERAHAERETARAAQEAAARRAADARAAQEAAARRAADARAAQEAAARRAADARAAQEAAARRAADARAEQEAERAEQEAAARSAAEARIAELLRERGGRDRR